MEIEPSSAKVTSREKQNQTPKLETLLEKLKLQGSIPNKERVFRAYNLIAERYQLPETFLDDEVNQTLLLGVCQKFTESTDPLFKQRLKGYIRYLVAPSMGRERFDATEIFGKGDIRGGLDKESQDKYIDSVTDTESTSSFKDIYRQALEEAQEAWLKKGYQLNLDTRIVSDDQLSFKSKTGGTGFVNVPDQEKLNSREVEPKITFVLLKGVSDKVEFVKHELYHLKDYFDFIRRGKGGAVLEGLDELHTEYSVGNYTEDKKEGSAYFVLKNFWNKASHMGNMDFGIIKDRKQAIEKISENFGLDGMLTFSLQDAQSSGSFSRFETFYSNPDRTVVELLIAKSKTELRKNLKSENLYKLLENIPKLLQELKYMMTPQEGDFNPKYLSIYDFITSNDKDTYSHSKKISPEKSRELVIAYTQAIALSELAHQKELKELPQEFEEIISLLKEIPYKRKKPNFNLETFIKDKLNKDRPFSKNEDELVENTYKSLYYSLTKDLEGIDYAFSIETQLSKSKYYALF